MPAWDEATLTERQRKWFASVRAGLERDTGRSLDAWAEVARACPETGHRARLAWLKTEHRLAQNRASQVLAAAFPAAPDDGADPLWADARERAIFEAVQALALGLPEVLVGRRKGYTPVSRKLQFAALRPVRGAVELGLALAPETSPRLRPCARPPWSERLKSVSTLRAPQDADAEVADLLRQAWARS